MSESIFISKKGIAFTIEATNVMRDFLESLRRDGATILIWSVAFNAEDKVTTTLCGDYTLHSLAIPDQIEDVVFYWYAEPKGLEAIRPYCIDVGHKRKSRLLKLPSMEPLYEDWQNI